MQRTRAALQDCCCCRAWRTGTDRDAHRGRPPGRLDSGACAARLVSKTKRRAVAPAPLRAKTQPWCAFKQRSHLTTACDVVRGAAEPDARPMIRCRWLRGEQRRSNFSPPYAVKPTAQLSVHRLLHAAFTKPLSTAILLPGCGRASRPSVRHFECAGEELHRGHGANTPPWHPN